MKAVNIQWDIDSHEEREFLPDEIEIPEGIVDQDDISDYISNVTGFCHKGYDLAESVADIIISDIKRQLTNKENETSYGEPQAWAALSNGRSIEVTLEQEGLADEEYFYSVRLHCNEREDENNDYHSTVGVIGQYSSSGSSLNELDALIRTVLSCNENYPVAEHSIQEDISQDLEFIFDDEIVVSEDFSSLEGYVWAMSSLVDRLKSQEPQLTEDQSMENINFYPVFDVEKDKISLEGHYYLEDSHSATGKAFTLTLTLDECDKLKKTFEEYCMKQTGKSCNSFLRDMRAEHKPLLPSLNDRMAKAASKAGQGNGMGGKTELDGHGGR